MGIIVVQPVLSTEAGSIEEDARRLIDVARWWWKSRIQQKKRSEAETRCKRQHSRAQAKKAKERPKPRRLEISMGPKQATSSWSLSLVRAFGVAHSDVTGVQYVPVYFLARDYGAQQGISGVQVVGLSIPNWGLTSRSVSHGTRTTPLCRQVVVDSVNRRGGLCAVRVRA